MRLVALLFMVVGLAACDDLSESQTTPALTSSSPQPVLSEDRMRKWATSCALCHVSGTGGAPRMGTAEWQDRLSKGNDVLMTHTIEGFNNMPPLGYCMACEREDFEAMIDFMSVQPQ